MISRQFNKR